MRGPWLETLAMALGAGLLVSAAPLDSVAGGLFAALGLALGVAGTATWWASSAHDGEKRWAAFAIRAGLQWTGGGMEGTWQGRPVHIAWIGRRVELRATLDAPLEPIFPVTHEGLRAHLAAVEAGSALPVPSLRQARARLALREAMSALPLSASGQELRVALDRDEVDEKGVEACLDQLGNVAAALEGRARLPVFWRKAA